MLDQARILGVEDKDVWMARRLGEELGKLHHLSLGPCSEPVTGTLDFEFLCSYTWASPHCGSRKSGDSPLSHTIYVPGDAPRVVMHDLPKRATLRDTPRTTYQDANMARFRFEPWRPMFSALQVMKPGYRLDDVDIIINRNALQALLLFTGGKRKRPFRLDTCMIKNTLLVTPYWRSGLEGGKKNFGHVFEHVFTEKDSSVHGHGSHHRAIRYKIGPLNCVVLFECDAQIGDVFALRDLKKPGWDWEPAPAQFGGQDLHDRVVEQMESVTQKERSDFEKCMPVSVATSAGSEPSLNVIYDGQGTPSSQVAELKAKSRKSNANNILQMWLGRTPYLVSGERSGTTFSNVHVRPAWPHLLHFEKKNQEPLQRLVSAIAMLKHYASVAPNQSCAVVSTNPDNSLRFFAFKDTRSLGGHDKFRRWFWRSRTYIPRPKAAQDVLEKRSPSKTTRAPGITNPRKKAAHVATSKQQSYIAQQKARNERLFTMQAPKTTAVSSNNKQQTFAATNQPKKPPSSVSKKKIQ